MDVAAYLERLRYSGPTAPTAETLRQLQRAHLFAVPFENLDIARHRQIVLDLDQIVRKLVVEKRGGFCYELNGAFAALLAALGFRVQLLSARVPRSDGTISPEFDHLTLRVDLPNAETWLADVGFGDSFIDPLRLQPGLEQRQARRTFRIVQPSERLEVQRTETGAAWQTEYTFTLQPHALAEFAAMCHYHQTSPESHFTRNQVCSLATPDDGRITLSEMRLIETRHGKKTERTLTSQREWESVLRDSFGVVLV